jgi:hypothetical protein
MSNKPNNQWLISGNQAKEISGLLSGYKVQARIDEILESLPEASFEQSAEIAALKAQIKQVVISDRIEWEDFPPASRLVFAQILKD